MSLIALKNNFFKKKNKITTLTKETSFFFIHKLERSKLTKKYT